MRAAPPRRPKSSKKRLLILAGGSVMGLLLGGRFVLARNFPFGVFRTSQQVTHATGLSCAVLPEIASADEQAAVEDRRIRVELRPIRDLPRRCAVFGP